MNEQIEKLMREAGMSFSYQTERIVSREEALKFAKLLIQECMEVTKNYTCTSTWDYNAPVALAKHFGVEE
jgi:hypothetical protein